KKEAPTPFFSNTWLICGKPSRNSSPVKTKLTFLFAGLPRITAPNLSTIFFFYFQTLLQTISKSTMLFHPLSARSYYNLQNHRDILLNHFGNQHNHLVLITEFQ